MSDKPEADQLWGRFRQYFWIIFGTYIVLYIVIEPVIFRVLQIDSYGLRVAALLLNSCAALLMVLNVGWHAYALSKKMPYALVGLLGLVWVGLVGIFFSYFAVQKIYYSSTGRAFSKLEKILFGLVVVVSLIGIPLAYSSGIKWSNIFSNTSAVSTQEWATVTSPDGNFSVELPRNPQYERDPKTIGYSYSASEQGEHVQYVVKYENYSSAVQSTGVELKNASDATKKTFLKALVDSTVESFSLSNFVSEFTTYKGRIANKFSGAITNGNDSGDVVGIVILGDEEAYYIISLTDDGYSASFDRVLQSLQFRPGL